MRATENDLNEGEVICNKCNGERALDVLSNPELMMECPKCKGAGKLDWIQNIMGKHYKIIDLTHLVSDPDGPVDLYYEGNKSFETTTTGIKSYMKTVGEK